MFIIEIAETVDSVAEGAGVTNLVPCEGRQAGCAGFDVSEIAQIVDHGGEERTYCIGP